MSMLKFFVVVLALFVSAEVSANSACGTFGLSLPKVEDADSTGSQSATKESTSDEDAASPDNASNKPILTLQHTFSACAYGGVQLGGSRLAPEGITNDWYSDGAISYGWSVLLGYRWSPHFFAELKYTDLGAVTMDNYDDVKAELYPDAKISYQAPSLMLGYFINEPKNHGFSLFIKAGVAGMTTSATDAGETLPIDQVNSAQFVIGGGLQYDFAQVPWQLRFDADAFDKDAQFYGITLTRYFGPERRRGIKTPKPKAKKSERDLDEGIAVVTEIKMPEAPITVERHNRPLSCAMLDEVAQSIRFEGKTDQLTFESKEELAKLAITLRASRLSWVEIQTHTDNTGDNNKDLTHMQALAIKEYLVAHKVSTVMLSVKFFGDSEPVASNDTEAGRQQNRRVKIALRGSECKNVNN